jgi:hypothetical protein
MEKMTTAPYIKELQFIVVSSTGVANGKKAKTYTNNKKSTAIILQVRPARPRLQRACGKGSPRILRNATHEIEIM